MLPGLGGLIEVVVFALVVFSFLRASVRIARALERIAEALTGDVAFLRAEVRIARALERIAVAVTEDHARAGEIDRAG
jgi:hypothetical protein